MSENTVEMEFMDRNTISSIALMMAGLMPEGQIKKYAGKTSDDIFPQTEEMKEYHLKRAEEKRQRKVSNKKSVLVEGFENLEYLGEL